MLDTTKLQENLSRKLARQQASLKQTLEELKNIETLQIGATPGAFAQLINQLRTKRDRQHTACLATEQYLAALATPGKKRA